MAGNSSVGKKDNNEVIFFNGDDSADTVREMDDAGKQINFDIENFLELPDDVARGLGHDNKERYFVARTLAKQHKEGNADPKSKEIKKRFKILGSMDMTAKSKFDGAKPFVAKGNHLAFKLPQEVDFAKEQGYKEVKGKDGTYVVKRGDKDEAVAMQIPDPAYKEHLQGVSQLSRRGLSKTFDEAKESAKAISRHGERVIVRDFGDNKWND